MNLVTSFFRRRGRPGAAAVARRAVILAVVYGRGEIEASSGQSDEAESESTRRRMPTWTDQVGLATTVTASERKLLSCPVGRLSRQDVVDASWRLESLGALLWALQELEVILAYDVQFTPGVLRAVPVPGTREQVSEFVRRARLRPHEVIERARGVAELWHWRARTTQIQRMGHEPPAGLALAQIIEMTAAAAHERGDLLTVIEGDFPAFGKAYRDLSESEYAVVNSIAMERHHALNWLCGYGRHWGNVPTDT